MQSRRAGIAVAVLGVAVLVVLFIVLSGGDDNSSSTTSTTASGSIPTIQVKDGEPVGGIQDLSFNEGDHIKFRVDSDADWEIHFHGYDIPMDVKAGGSVTFDVPATITGVFEVEIEQTGTQIAEITVNQ
ncbi:MAG: hypothetical protein ACJ75R_07335 [Solirubrobacterales bacterium]